MIIPPCTIGSLPPCNVLLHLYEILAGQHFLSHEDGFPANIALDKGYQRRATLLVYLNDVPQGGTTKFDHLGLGVQPEKGKALLFFPSFSGGRSDARYVRGGKSVDESHCDEGASWQCAVLWDPHACPWAATAGDWMSVKHECIYYGTVPLVLAVLSASVSGMDNIRLVCVCLPDILQDAAHC